MNFEPEEGAIFGREAIAALFNVSERKMRGMREELLDAGAIFYMRAGRPYKKRVCAFPSRLRAWAGLKAAAREII